MASFRRNRIHLAVLLAILVVEFFFSNLASIGYREYSRSQLLAGEGGYQECRGYRAVMPDRLPADCDVAHVAREGGRIVESYLSRDGAVQTRVVSLNGRMVTTERIDRFQVARRMFLLPAIAALVFLMVHKGFRLRTASKWLLLALPNDRLESLLFLYGASIFVSLVAFVLLGH